MTGKSDTGITGSRIRGIPLTMVRPGMRVRLIGIDAGRRLGARLAAMGLVPGVDLVVLANPRHGPFIVMVGESRLVLGRGMAAKMMVQ